jgi:DNA-3-methyladenine glycosylase
MPDRAPSRSLLTGPVLELAPKLLGYRLVDRTGPEHVVVRITEVEAYDGSGNDAGSHAHRGRTPRTEVMFGPPGHAYVYFTYGMHWCMNIVVGPIGTASAILVRAGEVLDGIAVARARRPTARSDAELARGPARLATALGIDGRLDGADLLDPSGDVGLLVPRPAAAGRSDGSAHGAPLSPAVRTGPRVGLTKAVEHPWRFWLDAEPSVSAYRPGSPRRRSSRHTEQ